MDNVFGDPEDEAEPVLVLAPTEGATVPDLTST
jgi:hypothetical protein